jgi:hypothetical protein
MSGAAIFAFFVVPLSALVLAYLAVLWHEHDVIWYGRHSVITNQPHTRSDTQAPDSHAKPAHDGQGDVSARETHLRSATNSVKPTMGAELGTFGVVTAALLRRRPRAVAVGGAAGEPRLLPKSRLVPCSPRQNAPNSSRRRKASEVELRSRRSRVDPPKHLLPINRPWSLPSSSRIRWDKPRGTNGSRACPGGSTGGRSACRRWLACSLPTR